MALMTKTLDRIQTLVAHNEVRVSLHGSEELAADDVQVRDVIAGVATAVMIEIEVVTNLLMPSVDGRECPTEYSCPVGGRRWHYFSFKG